MQGFNFDKILKVFVNTFHININKSGLFVAFQSGPNIQGFVVPLPLAKVLLKNLKERVDMYEKEHGEIPETGTTSGIQSPIQPGN